MAGAGGLVNFGTYTCINVLHAALRPRLGGQYVDQGLVVVGVHTPEFRFERDIDNVRRAVKDMRVDTGSWLDSDYAIWQAFANHYWPAVYIADAEGRIRHHHFGEGGYAGVRDGHPASAARGRARRHPDDVVSVEPEGFEAQADWTNLESPESYLGYEQARASVAGARRAGRAWDRTRSRGRSGSTSGRSRRVDDGTACLRARRPGGRIAFRFHARDVHLVMARAAEEAPFRSVCSSTASPPGEAHGLDVTEQGEGIVAGSGCTS